LGSDIQKKMLDQKISNREELDRLLHRSGDFEAIQKRIDTFHRDRNILLEQKKTLSATVSLLEKDPVLKGETQADPRLLQQELTTLDEELQSLLTGAGALGEKIEDLKAKLKQKESLSSDLEKQNIRGENLRELSSLFKGGKFVQYIAAVYMQEMCQLANRRFSPLTGRSLELFFQDNQIMVRDFLNEGRLRHIKTLSGGQSFQAALCLALALAEQTGRGKGSFFFLDEGFGSLDKASLETVMTTLRELSREGRIIGLISHVEEMQQDLDVWIRIKRDSEEGSSVQCSWKSSSKSETTKDR
jgi:DNA repair protein SbcC/Rad50